METALLKDGADVWDTSLTYPFLYLIDMSKLRTADLLDDLPRFSSMLTLEQITSFNQQVDCLINWALDLLHFLRLPFINSQADERL